MPRRRARPGVPAPGPATFQARAPRAGLRAGGRGKELGRGEVARLGRRREAGAQPAEAGISVESGRGSRSAGPAGWKTGSWALRAGKGNRCSGRRRVEEIRESPRQAGFGHYSLNRFETLGGRAAARLRTCGFAPCWGSRPPGGPGLRDALAHPAFRNCSRREPGQTVLR